MSRHARARTLAALGAAASIVALAGGCTDDADWAAAPLGAPVASESPTVDSPTGDSTTPEWLFVLDAPSARLVDGDTITLTLLEPGHVLAFTDRPDRDAEFVRPTWLAGEWARLFGDDPPNAVLTGLADDGSTVELAVVVDSVDGDGEELTVTLSPLAGRAELDGRPDAVPASLRQVALFVDDVVVPADAQDWTFHSIIRSDDEERYVSRAGLSTSQVDDEIYSIPATDLVEQFDQEHTTTTAPAG